MADLKTIAAELNRGEVVFFLGAGMSKDVGLPSTAELAEDLSNDFKPSDIEKPSLVEIADYCSAEHRRPQLNTEIRSIVKAAQDKVKKPSPAHVALANLKDVNLVITTNWDTLLEDACEAVKRPYYSIFTDADLEGRPKSHETLNILKMHGTLDSPGSYIVSEDDFARFKRNHSFLYRRLENIFIDQTVILIGYGMGDENFKRAYNDVRFEQRIPRQVYAVNPGISKSRMGVWWERNIEVLTDANGKPYDALTFFAELVPHLRAPAHVDAEQTIPLEASRYLTYLIDLVRPLTFQGIVQLENVAVTLNVDDLYVNLYASPEALRCENVEKFKHKSHMDAEEQQQERGASEPVQIEEALKKHNSIIVLGHPGAGKTTLMRYLTVVFAQGRAEEKLRLKEHRVPFLVPLAAYSAALRQEPDLGLLEFIPRYWRTETMTYDISCLLRDYLGRGDALILLDGLDEVFESAERKRVVAKVKVFFESWKRGNRFVITSRIVGYRDAPLEMDGLEHFTLQDFTDDEIRWFVRNWWSSYIHLLRGDTAAAREEANREAERLTAAIFRDPGVQSLATNPLLLAILALIHYSGKELPQKRVELYALYIKTLITSWSRRRTLAREALGSMEDVEAIKILAPLALWMHREYPAGTAPRAKIEEQVQSYYETKYLPAEAREAALGFVESLRKYTSLLVERGENAYGFLHLTFEEYLAAQGAILNGQDKRAEIFNTFRRDLYRPAWREVVRLTAEHLSLIMKEEKTASLFIRRILQDTPRKKGDKGKNAVLAGACLLNIGAAGVEKTLWDDVLGALEKTMTATTTDPYPFMRRDAGIILGDLGWLPGDLDAMQPVAGGPFLYGDKNRPRLIRCPFDIGKYPVTNWQFKRFIAAGGYKAERWWSQEGWKLRREESWERPSSWDDRRFNNPIQPVVGVSWYEADAYCRWLTLARNDSYKYRLPSEEEWEKAARGEKGRIYPWGKDFDLDQTCANTCLSLLGATTPVMMFPEGQSEYHVFDLVGNIWEWTGSLCSKKKPYPVVRGSSWNYLLLDLRCALRNWFDPSDRACYIGFRCSRTLK